MGADVFYFCINQFNLFDADKIKTALIYYFCLYVLVSCKIETVAKPTITIFLI